MILVGDFGLDLIPPFTLHIHSRAALHWRYGNLEMHHDGRTGGNGSLANHGLRGGMARNSHSPLLLFDVCR